MADATPVTLPEMLEALDDIIRWESHRIEHTHWLAIRGGCEPPPAVAFAGWRQRLARLEAAAARLREER